MRYIDIIKKLLNKVGTPAFLAKINCWAFANVKYFYHKATSFIYYFITNLKNFKIKELKFNNYVNLDICRIVIVTILFFLLFVL